MKKITNKIITYTTVLILTFIGIGCNSWLDLLPENDQTSDMYWNTKEDVEAVVLACYTDMRSCLLQLVQWGELRGDALTVTPSASTEESNITILDIQTTNSICKWDKFYNVIGNANAVIKYGPTVLEKDPTFAQEVLNSYIGEAKFMRALCYFYLVRTFGEVPLVLEPYVDDSQEFRIAKSDEATVLAAIMSDINDAINKCKPGYGDKLKNKARATRWAAYTLKADICLWNEDYDGAVKACDEVINSAQYRLIPGSDWFSIFYNTTGSSDEGIFELYWKKTAALGSGSTNSLYTWFWGTARYNLSYRSLSLFEEYTEDDYRGIGATYQEDSRIWKYAGTSATTIIGNVRGSTERDANWIFYRYADVLLMKAEALIMKNDISTAWDLLLTIRERAGHSQQLPQAQNIREAMEILLNERQMEFIAEGKRWFDILRMSKRNNYEYKDYITEVILENISAQDRAKYAAKLQDERGFFLPIHKDEITANNGVLEQNPYYNDLE